MKLSLQDVSQLEVNDCPMAINFDTENLVVLCYPREAGGKFLINCLGLSNNAVLQDSLLANEQLNGKIDQLKKFELITSRLGNVPIHWNDLDMGCLELFGVDNSNYLQLPPEQLKLQPFNPVVDLLSHSDKKFFLVAHTPALLRKYLQVWPKAKVIYFYNCFEFIKFRLAQRPYLRAVWDSVKLPHWPTFPPNSTDEYNLLNSTIKDEIANCKAAHELFGMFKEYDLKKIEIEQHDLAKHEFTTATTWNNHNYFSVETTIDEIRKLYILLELTDFSDNLIKEYHQLWINKLLELKNNMLKIHLPQPAYSKQSQQ